jgi:protein-S-isoprenylcysteine O-methyltransferase Ste14
LDRRALLRVWLPLVGGLLGLLGIFWLGPGPHGVARVVGLLLGLIGLGVVILSRHTLGQSFSVAPKAKELVTRGIYSRIRNPIYIFAEVFLLGLTVILWRPELLILLAILIPAQVIRARKEAAVLEERFGDSYRAYRKQTWF